MKRTNVVLDEEILEKAVELSGERTYSGAINRALNEMVRKLTVDRGIERLADADSWWPGYAEELYGAEWVRQVTEKLKKKGIFKSDGRTVVMSEVKKAIRGKRRGSR